MKLLRSALLWVGVMVAPLSSPLAGVAIGQTRPANYQAAYTLAQSLRSRETVLIETGRVFEDGGIAQLMQNADLAALEKAHPGIVKYMFTQAKPTVEQVTVDRLPELWDALANIYAGAMTAEELAQAQAYYTSPAGTRFRMAILKNYDTSKELSAVAKNPDGAFSGSTIREGVVAGVPGALGALSAADQQALMTFAKTPAFKKIQTINPAILDASAAWGSRQSPEGQAKVNKIMGEAAAAFVSREPKAAKP